MRIRATLQYMAESEIKAMIPNDKIAEIKKKTPKPIFKAFVVGHEGEARGNLVGVGNIIKQWFKSTVKMLYDKIRVGLQLFHGHAETNDNEGRLPIGEVVGKAEKTIDKKLSTVVACWIYPDYSHLPLDVASIEANIDLAGDEESGYKVLNVDDVTGIALGNSQVETPGFPGATLLGQLQAFAKDKNIKIGMETPDKLKLGYFVNKNGSALKLDRSRERRHTNV